MSIREFQYEESILLEGAGGLFNEEFLIFQIFYQGEGGDNVYGVVSNWYVLCIGSYKMVVSYPRFF